MRIILYILTFLVFTPISNVAYAGHADKLVDQGMRSYQSRDYDNALKVLNEAINDKSLHHASVPKAYYYRGVTNLALGRANKISDKKFFLFAFNDLKKAQLTDTQKKEWEGIVSDKLNELKPFLVKRGLFLFKTIGEEHNDDATNSKLYFEALTELEPSIYVYHDYIGQCELILKDTTKALESFTKAQEVALATQDEKVDFVMGYSFYNSAKIYGLQKHNIEQGLLLIKEARKYLDQESKELDRLTVSVSTDQYKTLLEQRNQVDQVLDRLELELSSKSGSAYHRTINNYKKALSQNENDIPVLIAYATYIEGKDREGAIELYQKVINADPQYFMAYYGIGALYVEEGGEYMNKSQENIKQEKKIEFSTLGKNSYTKAIPYFEKAYELNSNEPVFLQTIIQLSKAVGDEKKHQHYNKL